MAKGIVKRKKILIEMGLIGGIGNEEILMNFVLFKKILITMVKIHGILFSIHLNKIE